MSVSGTKTDAVAAAAIGVCGAKPGKKARFFIFLKKETVFHCFLSRSFVQILVFYKFFSFFVAILTIYVVIADQKKITAQLP